MIESIAEQSEVSAVVSTGQLLARARQKQDMSVGDVARALRLGVKQIEALEADDHANLPGRTFVRGFIRNYARLVRLDPDQVLSASQFGAETKSEARHIQAPSQQISFSEHGSKPWLKSLLAGFMVVALISWGVLEWLGPEQARTRVITSNHAAAVAPEAAGETPATAASEASAQPPAIAPAAGMEPASQPVPPSLPVPPVPAAAVQPQVQPQPLAQTQAQPQLQPQAPAAGAKPAALILAFSGPAWVEVRDRNGKKILSQTNPAGSQQGVEGEPPLSLVIGSAPNVKLTYKGQPVDLSAYTKAEVARLTLE